MGRGDSKQLVERMTLLESGLWTARPAVAYAIENKLSARQEAVFVLDAPDAEHARAAYEAEHPEAAAERAELHASFDAQQGVGL